MKQCSNDMKSVKQFSTGNLSDADENCGVMNSMMKSINQDFKIAGPAFTVKCKPGDNLAIHLAIAEAPAGSVLVIDAGGYLEAGHLGEIMVAACMERGLVGVVIDGACRDASAINQWGFPVFCRGLNPKGTLKEDAGIMNGSIQCGGVTVEPGDFVFGDADGIVVIQKENVSKVIEKTNAIVAKERDALKRLREGKTTMEIFGFSERRWKHT